MVRLEDTENVESVAYICNNSFANFIGACGAPFCRYKETNLELELFRKSQEYKGEEYLDLL